MSLSRFVSRRTAIWGAAFLAGAVLAGALAAPSLVASRLRSAGRARGLDVAWRTLRVAFPARLQLAGLSAVDAAGDTAFAAESLSVALHPLPLLVLRPRIASLDAAHVRVRRPAEASDADTLPPEEPAARGVDRTRKVQHAAESLVRALLLPARRLPRLALRDVTLETRDGPALRLESLVLGRAGASLRLTASGVASADPPVPFTIALGYADDDRLQGHARFGIADAARGAPDPLDVTLDGRIEQNRAHGEVRIADSTRVTIGQLAFALSGTISRNGPRFRLGLSARELTAAKFRESLPPPVLGPLEGLAVRGSTDYRVSLDLDVSQPDSVRFDADVIPHDLVLGAGALDPTTLAGPGPVSVHLPHERIETRDLSDANPHFRTLDRIDSLLVHAVVTNEDGGFFHHRGFNTEAVRGAIADDIRAGAYRRGAGTITMQLVRNLYLGHARTLSRKGQEVVLAWVVEHLAHLDKRRLLEIYLNIIEWGPNALGADEATHYYFGHDAGHVSLSEALFLTTVIPAPAHWRNRFDRDGTLRPFERAQMHFIARAMVAKGWLDPADLPAAEDLHVELSGPARAVLFPEAAPPAEASGDEPARD
ncbi:MAG TPA: transglycosylase domain-containing protein [Candidatus Saccharimonadaceae bacterium]|jgi:hypothetical protein|nr:transglycosylase domain-containing protein [Candidatus Saccharimonadaceae bacterium]